MKTFLVLFLISIVSVRVASAAGPAAKPVAREAASAASTEEPDLSQGVKGVIVGTTPAYPTLPTNVITTPGGDNDAPYTFSPSPAAPASAASAFPGGNFFPTNQMTPQQFNQFSRPLDSNPNPVSPTQKYQYGGKGGGDIGDGLCTQANANRAQVKNGYCADLNQILNDPTSCAYRALQEITQEAASPNGVKDLNKFCPNFASMQSGTQQTMVFEQILAGLITKESEWDAHGKERPWTNASGAPMGGLGLFQIGVNDSAKGGDCAAINSTSIMDPKTNLRCGACIALVNLAHDHAMGSGVGDHGTIGMARYFGPFRDGQSAKRDSIASGVSKWCQSNGSGTSAPAAPSDPPVPDADTSGSTDAKSIKN
jgi:hypothetical protein